MLSVTLTCNFIQCGLILNIEGVFKRPLFACPQLTFLFNAHFMYINSLMAQLVKLDEQECNKWKVLSLGNILLDRTLIPDNIVAFGGK